jgi:alpha-N-arabinofuranosidase
MTRIHRRRFLANAASATALAWAPSWLLGNTPSDKTGRVLIEPNRLSATLDRRLFGSFLEHIGRAIYTGIYEPGSRLADKHGFRKDVIDELRTVQVPIVRYPGGNFVSGYDWRDGIGPKDKRPRILDRAWNSLETNQFGTDEFITWCKQVGTEPFLAVNLGSGSAENAAALVEYCNVDKGTRWSDVRCQNGHAVPHDVRAWCLGNEMDGPWQIGHLPADEYGRKAADAARQMRAIDRSIQLVACGSSGPGMPTYLEWDRKVLEHCYGDVDAISLHRYFDKREVGNRSDRFLAMNLAMERQIREVGAVCDYVRTRLRSSKRLWLSCDEWNVWYRTFFPLAINGKRQHAPKLVEEIYSLEDALLVGGIINTLLRNADRVRIGCLAQLVNVIAPIMTNAKQLVRQTIFYPYAWALKFARGKVLDLWVESETYEVPDVGQVPYLDAAGTLNAKTGESTIFLLNRDLSHEREVSVLWRESAPKQVWTCQVLTGEDLKQSNSFTEPNRVVPRDFDVKLTGDQLRIKLPARSYTVVQLKGETRSATGGAQSTTIDPSKKEK